MSLEYSEIRLPNPGITKTRLPVRVFAQLTADLQKQVDSNPATYNNHLAGQLETELAFKLPDYLKECLNEMYLDYRERFDFFKDNDYVIEGDSWVNFQKKNEFNPLHYHFHDVVWVLWVTIPYDLKKELDMPNVKKSNGPVGSKFQFVYNKLDGGIDMYCLDIDSSWEGTMVMFPAYLKHQVYPFQTSDEHRISLAGNITVVK